MRALIGNQAFWPERDGLAIKRIYAAFSANCRPRLARTGVMRSGRSLRGSIYTHQVCLLAHKFNCITNSKI